MPADQYAAESGVEYSRMDSFGTAPLAGYQRVVVRGGVGAWGLWILRMLLGMWLIGWARACGAEKDSPKENKNPYSVRKTGGGAN